MMAERIRNRDEVQQFLDLASAPDRSSQDRCGLCSVILDVFVSEVLAESRNPIFMVAPLKEKV